MQVIRFALIGAAALGAAVAVQAQTILIDDFRDGDDLGWTHADKAGGISGSPSIFDASSGEYVLATTAPLSGGPELEWVASSYDASYGPGTCIYYGQGVYGYRVRTEESEGKLALGFRHDPSSTDSYLAIAYPELDLVGIWVEAGGVATGLTGYGADPASWTGDPGAFLLDRSFDFTTHEDWMFEVGAVGDELSMKFWKASDPEPPAPQLTVTDSTYADGGFYVMTYGQAGATHGLSAAFDDLWFTPADVQPTIDGFTPESVPALEPFKVESVTLNGSNLSHVGELLVNGLPLDPAHDTWTILGDDTITFELPLLSALGPVDVTVVMDGCPTATASAQLDVVAPSPPALQLEEGLPAPLLLGGTTVAARVGGQPADLAFLAASLSLSPSISPGLLALDIGAGFTDLYLLGSQAIESKGWTQFDLLLPTTLPPLTQVHLQAVELDPVSLTVPLEVSNTFTFWLMP